LIFLSPIVNKKNQVIHNCSVLHSFLLQLAKIFRTFDKEVCLTLKLLIVRALLRKTGQGEA